MGVIQITEELLNKACTENGDTAYRTSLSHCLDYFSLAGALRGKYPLVTSLFLKAYHEDPQKAVKLLFYTRDIRSGLGERGLFRYLLNYLANINPNITDQLIPYIPEYGRYDDLLSLLKTPSEPATVSFIEKQLREDKKNKAEGKPISLLSKWLPSINTSNGEARSLALYLAKRLKMSNANYRKMLSYLREGIIIENNLREKDYSFDYSAVPGLAMQKYRHAFFDWDKSRFQEYLKAVKTDSSRMHVGTMDVVSLVRHVDDYENEATAKELSDFYETAWKALVEEGVALNRRTIVVRDGSGSMEDCGGLPLDIANAMTLLTAERLQGEFHNRFITFSSRPKLIDLDGYRTLKEKKEALLDQDDYTNTNIEKVYDLILKIYLHRSFTPADALDQILIISDMEFDGATESDAESRKSTFAHFDEKFKKLGYRRPQVIFWNVNAHGVHVPVQKDQEGTVLVSGQSKNIIDMVVSNHASDPLAYMDSVLLRYRFVDCLSWEKK